jgi:hypothetical protein
MDAWLEPLFDAEGMRAVDDWAIEQQGVPSLELMETSRPRSPSSPRRVPCG